jgi:hypothetical protein
VMLEEHATVMALAGLRLSPRVQVGKAAGASWASAGAVAGTTRAERVIVGGRTSTHAKPSPAKPSSPRQAQVKLPGVSAHVALAWQLWVPRAHSLMS